MTDQIRQLDAERLRPPPPPETSIEELLSRLIATIHQAYKTPPDEEKK